MTDAKLTMFLLGATGYLTSQLLLHTSQDPELKDRFSIKALLRNATPQRIAQLKGLYPDITPVEGDLNSDDILREQAATADFVINTSDGDHTRSLNAILAGLEENSAANPGKPPVYIHFSGPGITSDNSRGAKIPLSEIPSYTDVGLDLSSCPPQNPHLDQDKSVIAAGTRKENPVRTALVYPGWIYGVGKGLQTVSMPLRMYLDLFEKAGFAGTWGEGYSRFPTVHIKDAVSAVVIILKAFLAGKADEGADGIYFAMNEEGIITHREITAKASDVMFEKGILSQPGSQPFPDKITEPMGEYGWAMFGANHTAIPKRLEKFGWRPTESIKKSIVESIPDEVLSYLRISGKIIA